jgi:putative transposase
MARVARLVIPDLPHHVTHRGNNRQAVFFTEDDYHVYLSILRRKSDRHGLEMMGYCLMPNHIHLVAKPRKAKALAKAVGETHWQYARYINERHKRSGHLWENRFYSCPLDESHEYSALAYVDRNPVRAGLVRLAWKYPWSSASAHAEGADPRRWVASALCRRLAVEQKWKSVLRQGEDAEMLKRIRTSTMCGRPLATDSFLAKLEHAIGRRLRPASVGRPKKIRDRH